MDMQKNLPKAFSPFCFFFAFRRTLHFQNTVNVSFNNIVFLDLIFTFAILGLQGFFLLLQFGILLLQRGNIGEFGNARRL